MINTTIEHHPKTRAIMKQLEKDVDDFMFAREVMRGTFDQAIEVGGVGIFLLDCLVAELQASDKGLGKLPVTDPGKIENSSALMYQVEPLKRVCEIIEETGLQVGIFAFLGDDDWKYSVSPDFGIANPEIGVAIGQQVATMQAKVKTEFENVGIPISVMGWMSQEERNPNLMETRDFLLDALKHGAETEKLPPKIAARLKQFSGYREKMVELSGIDSQQINPPISELALQEMTSFAFQGLAAPDVIHQLKPELPLIFANTFPNSRTQKLDDECVRFGTRHCGLAGYQYGTIHLSGSEGLAYKMKQKESLAGRQVKSRPGKMFTCGDPGSFNPKK